MTPPNPLEALIHPSQPTLRINVTPVPDKPVCIPGRKTMPSKSILDPSFEYRSDCKTFAETHRKVSTDQLKDCIALLRDADRRLAHVGYNGDTTVRLDIAEVMRRLESI